MPLTRQQSRAHARACKLLDKTGLLTFDERHQILTNYHEAGDNNNKIDAAHFTPEDLASDFRLDVSGPNILDLCAGIGSLSFPLHHYCGFDEPPNIVCVEINERYVEVGKRILPKAEWICADIFDHGLQRELRSLNFTTAISNPPYGNMAMRGRKPPRYTGSKFEYAALDIAESLAENLLFLIPQQSAPFRYSGVQCFRDLRHPRKDEPLSEGEKKTMQDYQRFIAETGIDLFAGCGVDTSTYKDDWRNVSPMVEIVQCMEEHRVNTAPLVSDVKTKHQEVPPAHQLSLL